ncbi:MAG: right-handed parallel beta-helix repeat-containing protein [Methylococcaceae bacterium]
MAILFYPIRSIRLLMHTCFSILVVFIVSTIGWAGPHYAKDGKVLIPVDSGTKLPNLPHYNMTLPNDKPGEIFKVGPTQVHTIPSSAAAIAQDGDTIEIEAGVYPADAAVWNANNLTIRGIGGRVHLRADGASVQGKAIWVISGENVTIENIEFSGAKVSDRNGAGIRHQGGNLTIRNCYFHNNENGVLVAKNPIAEILIENSEFAQNGYGDGQSHNMYIGKVKKFTLRYSYSHHATIGHNVKTRAKENYILYNRIMDEADGDSSYIVQFPNGGQAYLIGNLLQQGPKAPNSTMVSYGDEGIAKDIAPEFYVANNTFVNERKNGRFLRFGKDHSVTIVNNIFFGKGALPSEAKLGIVKRNLVTTVDGFIDSSSYNYHLRQDSSAINKAIDPGSSISTISLTPTVQYKHSASSTQRPDDGKLDVGAFEYRSK